jgi:hypothetical protein
MPRGIVKNFPSSLDIFLSSVCLKLEKLLFRRIDIAIKNAVALFQLSFGDYSWIYGRDNPDQKSRHNRPQNKQKKEGDRRLLVKLLRCFYTKASMPKITRASK